MSEKRKANGHSRPEDFLLPYYEPITEVTLPSGLPVKLRSPIDMPFWLRVGQLPGWLASTLRGETAGEPSPEELEEWAFRVLCALIAEPVFSMQPKAGEFHPRQLRIEDRIWLKQHRDRLAPGGGGAALEPFRKEQRKPAGTRRGGEEIRESSE